jgi:GntR family transcriptional regulator
VIADDRDCGVSDQSKRSARIVPPKILLAKTRLNDQDITARAQKFPSRSIVNQRRESAAACDCGVQPESGEKNVDIPPASCIIELIQPLPVRGLLLLRERIVLIHISTGDGVPIYLQVVNQIKYLVAAGRLTAGEELPPIRVLADQLLINPNTVARAYRELESAGIVEKRRTAGTYITDQGSPLARRERIKILTERIDALAAEALQMNISLEDVLKLVQQRHAALSNGTGVE